mgnify:CR=1 FL=1
MSEFLKVAKIEKLMELHALQAQLQRGYWHFRGHADSDWILESSLERFFNERIGGVSLEKNMAEQTMLREFKKEAHNYDHTFPESEDVLGWFAIMQHYGCPTRLLDITRSLYIALFFTLENATSESDRSSAVWVFSDPVSYYQDAGIYNHDKTKGASDSLTAMNRVCFEPDAPKTVLATEMRRRNLRMSCQQGWFLVPVSGQETLRQQLSIAYGLGEGELEAESIKQKEVIAIDQLLSELPGTRIFKLEIPSSLRIDILDHLRRCNVNAHQLFPGLDGLARSLKFRCEEWQRFGIPEEQ